MKYILPILGLCALAFFSSLQATLPQNSRLTWHLNYEKAVNQAQAESKFLVLFFTWTDNCTWCTKLEDEVLDSGVC